MCHACDMLMLHAKVLGGSVEPYIDINLEHALISMVEPNNYCDDHTNYSVFVQQ